MTTYIVRRIAEGNLGRLKLGAVIGAADTFQAAVDLAGAAKRRAPYTGRRPPVASKKFDWMRIAPAAEQAGLPRQTVQYAVQRGEIDSRVTACGVPLVTLADVKSWIDRRPRAGRPPKTKKGTKR